MRKYFGGTGPGKSIGGPTIDFFAEIMGSSSSAWVYRSDHSRSSEVRNIEIMKSEKYVEY